MAARCSPCDIDYPSNKKTCEACNEPTWQVDESYDNDWRDKADRRRRMLQGHIPDIKDEVVVRDTETNQQWVADEALDTWGYEACKEFDVILVCGTYYELAGRIRRGSHSGWWATPIPLEWDENDHPVMTDREYKELELLRGLRT